MSTRIRPGLGFRLSDEKITRIQHWENAASRGWADVEFAGWITEGAEPMTKAEARRFAAERGRVAVFDAPGVSGRGRWPKEQARG